MSVTVTLFKGISPNYGKHYKFFSSYADYIDSLGNYYKRYTLTDDRISDNQIIFSAAENVDAAEVSYCYINRNDGNSNQAYYFYHVTSGSVRGGMAFLQLELDVWATYLLRVNFGEIYVERCNRAILSNGIVDDYRTTGVPTFTQLGNFTATNATIAIVFYVAYKLSASIFSESATKTILYATPLNQVTNPGTMQEDKPFEQIIAEIGGIYGVLQKIATFEYVTDANVISAFLCPVSMLDNALPGSGQFALPDFKTKSEYGDKTITPRILCRPGRKTYTVQVPASMVNIQYIGTKYSQMRIPAYTNSVTATYEFITKADGLTVNVICGDKRLDLTNDFALDITLTNTGYNTGEKIRRAIELGKDVAALANKDINALGDIAGKAFADVAYSRTTGDAASIFYNKSNVNYNSPFTLTRYTATAMAKNARENGADFSAMYEGNLVSIFDKDFIGTAGTTDTYIQGDIDCYGAQKDVIDFFVQRFREGVYLDKI